MTRTISKEQYWQAVGLIELSKHHNQMLKSIEKALGSTLNEPEDEYGGYGLATDAVFSNDRDIDTLLKHMKIKVVEAPEATERS